MIVTDEVWKKMTTEVTCLSDRELKLLAGLLKYAGESDAYEYLKEVGVVVREYDKALAKKVSNLKDS